MQATSSTAQMSRIRFLGYARNDRIDKKIAYWLYSCVIEYEPRFCFEIVEKTYIMTTVVTYHTTKVIDTRCNTSIILMQKEEMNEYNELCRQ